MKNGGWIITSWVHPPSSYKQDAVSSLSVAFEDPDGTKSKALLAERHLYLFGTRATVKKWKYHQNNKDNSKTSAAKHSQSSDSTDEQNIERSLQTQPPSSSLSATPAPHQTVPKMASESAFTTPSHPPRSATIKAHNAIKEAVAGDLDQLLRSKDLKVRLARNIEWWRLNYRVQGSVPLAQERE